MSMAWERRVNRRLKRIEKTLEYYAMQYPEVKRCSECDQELKK